MIPHMSLGKGGAGSGAGEEDGQGCGRENKKEVEKARWRQDGRTASITTAIKSCTKHVRC